MFTKTKKWLLSFMTLICAVLVAIGVGLALPWGSILPQKTVRAETTATAVTFTHKEGGKQDDLTRYLITVTETIDTSGSNDITVDVYKNGSFIGEKTVNLYDADGTKRYVIVPYSTLVENATTYSEIVDKYVIVLKKGTVFSGSYYVADEMAWYITGNTVNYLTDKGEVALGATSGTAQDNFSENNPAKRYLVYYLGTTAIADAGITSYRMPMTISKDGVETTGKDFETYFNSGLTVISYATLTGDDTITTAGQITDTYTVTLKKGSIITDGTSMVTISNSVIWTISKYSISYIVDFGELTLDVSSSTSQDKYGDGTEAKRYLTYLSGTTGLYTVGIENFNLPITISKSGSETKQASFICYFNNGLMVIPYADLTGDSTITTAEQITDTYILTLEKGTVISSGSIRATVGNTLVWSINKKTIQLVTSIGDITFNTYYNAEGTPTFAIRENDYYTVVTYDKALGIEGTGMCVLPVQVAKNGESIDTNTATLWLNGAEYSKDYAGLIFDFINKSTIGSDLYTVTLKKGTVIIADNRVAFVANDISWFMHPDGTFWTVGKDFGRVTVASNANGVAEDELNRYSVSINTSADISQIQAEFSVPMLVSKNGGAAEQKNFTLTNTGIAFDYKTLLGDENATAASVTDEYTVTLAANTILKYNDKIAILANEVKWYITGETVVLVTGINLGKVTFGVSSSTSQDKYGDGREAKRYLTYLSNTTDLYSNGIESYALPIMVSKNGGEATQMSFWVYFNDGTTVIPYADLTGDSTITTAEEIMDTYILTLKKGTIINSNSVMAIVAEDIQWYICKYEIGAITETVNVTLGTSVIENNNKKQAWVKAQDDNDAPRYGAWFTAMAGNSSLADLTETDTVTFPMTVYKNKGQGETNGEKIFTMTTNEVYSNAGPKGDWNFDKDCTFVAIKYADICALSGTSFTTAAENKDTYIVVIEAGTPICVKSDGTLVVFENSLSIYLSGEVGMVSKGDQSVFSTQTSFKLDYTGNTLTGVKMRFRGVLSGDVYSYLDSLGSAATLNFYVKVNNGAQDITLNWSWSEIKSNGVSVDTDGDGVIDGYAFSAVIAIPDGQWKTKLTAQAYVHVKVNAASINKICYFGQTQYSVNSLAEKYNEMGVYAEDQQLLDYLSTANGL